MESQQEDKIVEHQHKGGGALIIAAVILGACTLGAGFLMAQATERAGKTADAASKALGDRLEQLGTTLGHRIEDKASTLTEKNEAQDARAEKLAVSCERLAERDLAQDRELDNRLAALRSEHGLALSQLETALRSVHYHRAIVGSLFVADCCLCRPQGRGWEAAAGCVGCLGRGVKACEGGGQRDGG